MKIRLILLMMALTVVEAHADSTLDAAIGGGVGGAVGAAIGHEVGGRDGAVVGGALGGAVGAAVTTEGDSKRSTARKKTYYRDGHTHDVYPSRHFCPPGQAKKGRC